MKASSDASSWTEGDITLFSKLSKEPPAQSGLWISSLLTDDTLNHEARAILIPGPHLITSSFVLCWPMLPMLILQQWVTEDMSVCGKRGVFSYWCSINHYPQSSPLENGQHSLDDGESGRLTATCFMLQREHKSCLLVSFFFQVEMFEQIYSPTATPNSVNKLVDNFYTKNSDIIDEIALNKVKLVLGRKISVVYGSRDRHHLTLRHKGIIFFLKSSTETLIKTHFSFFLLKGFLH